MGLELITLLVGLITSFFRFESYGLQAVSNMVAFLIATMFYFSGLIFDYILSRKFGVEPRSNIIGAPVWAWWCVNGIVATVVQFFGTLKSPNLLQVWWFAPLIFLASIVTTVALFAIVAGITDKVKAHYSSRPKALR